MGHFDTSLTADHQSNVQQRRAPHRSGDAGPERPECPAGRNGPGGAIHLPLGPGHDAQGLPVQCRDWASLNTTPASQNSSTSWAATTCTSPPTPWRQCGILWAYGSGSSGGCSPRSIPPMSARTTAGQHAHEERRRTAAAGGMAIPHGGQLGKVYIRDLQWRRGLLALKGGAPVFTSVAVAPPTASVVVTGTQAFTATALDQNGTPLSPQPTFDLLQGVSGGGSTSPPAEGLHRRQHAVRAVPPSPSAGDGRRHLHPERDGERHGQGQHHRHAGERDRRHQYHVHLHRTSPWMRAATR